MDTDRAVERRDARGARSVSSAASIATRASLIATRREARSRFPMKRRMKRARIEKTAYEKVIGCASDWERTQLDTSPASNQETGVFRERIYAKRSAYQISSISTDSALGRSKIRFREIPDSSPVR